MRKSILVGLLCIVSASSAWSGDAVKIADQIRLDGPADLGRLRANNPGHYARAMRVIAAANQLCRPGAPKLQATELDAREVSCAHAFLMSDPSKRSISFALDQTHYLAIVVITDSPAALQKAE
jgi:hypothetical protein